MTKLRQSVAITKADIAKYAAMEGHANSTPVKLGGKSYAARTLLFVTFEGRLIDKLYRGDYLFSVGKFDGADVRDLNTLPGLNGDKVDGLHA